MSLLFSKKKTSLKSSNVIIDGVGCRGFPNGIDPLMHSNDDNQNCARSHSMFRAHMDILFKLKVQTMIILFKWSYNSAFPSPNHNEY